MAKTPKSSHSSKLPAAFWSPRTVTFAYTIKADREVVITFPKLKEELNKVEADPTFDKSSKEAAQLKLRKAISLALAFDDEKVADQILRAIKAKKDFLNTPKYSKDRMNMAIWPLSIITVRLGGQPIESTAAFKGKKTVRDIEVVVVEHANK